MVCDLVLIVMYRWKHPAVKIVEEMHLDLINK